MINNIADDLAAAYDQGFEDGRRSNVPLPMMIYYKKALRDAYNWLESRSNDIKFYRLGTYDCMMAFLKMFAETPIPLMEYGDEAEYDNPEVVKNKIQKYRCKHKEV